MQKSLENIIKKHIDDPVLVNKIIVTVFAGANRLQQVQNQLINSLILQPSHPLFVALDGVADNFDFDGLIEAFEIAIPSQESQTNGAVYTPSHIKEYIIEKVLNDSEVAPAEMLGADISCGCGAFLFSLAQHIKRRTGKRLASIYQEQIFGLDISSNSIERAQILLSLLAIVEGEDVDQFDFNLFIGNSLDFDWQTIDPVAKNRGFDLIVGNPPYVRAKHLDKASKALLKNWQVTQTGNPDLYIPFFEIGISHLNENGRLGYITVNSFFTSVNARSLRKYLSAHAFAFEIINFGHEQVFENKLTYTCLCFLAKHDNKYLRYTKTTSYQLQKLKPEHFDTIYYGSLDDHRGWLLNNPKSLSNIKRIENTGTPLGELLPIKNGIATLSNSIYIFRPVGESTQYYHFVKDGVEYQVEKGICRDIIKPNILKYEHEIPQLQEKVIYPYTNALDPLRLISEDLFRAKFSKAYAYLEKHKPQLAKRDKGKGDYGAWYAFGRTQALTDKGLKLLFPYMAKHPHFVFTDKEEMLIYCGYAIFSESKDQLLLLKKILESSVFDYYMHNTSKPYASGYFSYAKNYVKHFGVCDLTKEEKEALLALTNKVDIDQFVQEKYQVVLA